jgi:hypothetical protein
VPAFARRLIIGVAVLFLSVLSPAAVQADSIVDWTCSTVSWLGSIMPTVAPTLPEDRSSGTVKHCITVIKKSDVNAAYNFYEVRMEDTWTIGNNGDYSDNHAHGFISVMPSATEYWATPSVRSDHSCFNALSFSFSWSGFGIGITPEICFDTWITRTYQSTGIAHWDTPNILRTHVWDQVYFVKVSQSSHPKFTAGMHYPWYAIKYDYAWGGWRNYEAQRLISLSVQT